MHSRAPRSRWMRRRRPHRCRRAWCAGWSRCRCGGTRCEDGRTMRILSINHTSDVYGASRCLERLAERLVRGGHEIQVIMPEPGPLKDALEAHGVKVLMHPLLAIVDRNTTRTWGRRLSLLATFPLSVAFIALAILRFRPDV